MKNAQILLAVIVSISQCYWIIIGSGGQWLCFIYFSEKESTQQEKGLLSAVLACKCVWFFIFIFCIGVCCVALSFFDAWLWRIGFIQFFVLLNIGQALTYLQYWVWSHYTKVKRIVCEYLNINIFHFVPSASEKEFMPACKCLISHPMW